MKTFANKIFRMYGRLHWLFANAVGLFDYIYQIACPESKLSEYWLIGVLPCPFRLFGFRVIQMHVVQALCVTRLLWFYLLNVGVLF
jgi:hypothetical protein